MSGLTFTRSSFQAWGSLNSASTAAGSQCTNQISWSKATTRITLASCRRLPPLSRNSSLRWWASTRAAGLYSPEILKSTWRRPRPSTNLNDLPRITNATNFSIKVLPSPMRHVGRKPMRVRSGQGLASTPKSASIERKDQHTRSTLRIESFFRTKRHRYLALRVTTWSRDCPCAQAPSGSTLRLTHQRPN